MMKSNISILLLLGCLFGSAAPALADGMMVTAPEYYVRETAQQALIKMEGSNEILTILPSFQSNSGDFAWVIPLPAPPTLESADERLFSDLDQMTRPRYSRRDGDWSSCSQNDYAVGVNSDDVNIISEEIVGYYQTMVVEAQNATALTDSLTQWGFLHSENQEDVAELIATYVDEGWSFTAVKVDSATFAETFPDHYDYYYGNLAPLQFTFASEEMIYPMRISALSAADSNPVVIYALADRRMDFPGAHTRYANRFTSAEIAALGHYSTVRPLLQPGDFLTHLQRPFTPAEMTEDITLVPAADNEEFWLIYYSGLPWLSLFLLGPAVLWGLYRKFIVKV